MTLRYNGDIIVGNLEINKGILQIVNEDEIVSFKKRDINGKKVYFIYFDF